MRKVNLELSKWYKVLAPRPTVLVSTINSKGETNAAPFSFVMPVSTDPPLIAFASVPTRHTAKNILETKDFVVGIPGKDLLEEVWECSEDYPYGVSEIEKAGLTEIKSGKVKSPKIKECFASFECKLYNTYQSGDHLLIIGEVVGAEIADDLWQGAKFQVERAKPLMHIGGPEFGLPGEIISAE